ncbi:MAG: hypothetical protein ACTS5I_03635 [Rhodanobacter sp.]
MDTPPLPNDDALEVAIREAVEAADAAAQNASDTGVIEPAPEPESAPDDDDDPFVSSLPDAEPEPFIEPTEAPTPTPAQIPAGYDPAGARRMAPSLARHLKNKGRSGYDRKLMQDFQRKAGIEPDKIYGGQSAGAVLYYGGTDAPPPFFPPLQIVPYTPPA